MTKRTEVETSPKPIMNLVLVTKKVLSEDELLLVVEGLVSVAVEEGVAPSKSSPYSELVLRSTE